MKEFNARYGDRRGSETLKPEHRTQARFHTAMVLFNQVIQIFRRAHLRDSVQFTIGFHLANCPVTRRPARNDQPGEKTDSTAAQTQEHNAALSA